MRKEIRGRVAVLGINANDVDTHAKESMADMTAQAQSQDCSIKWK